jgi:hypothetical protein
MVYLKKIAGRQTILITIYIPSINDIYDKDYTIQMEIERNTSLVQI